MPLGEGVILRVDHFALTANNVTYAAFGDRMSYWDFFPITPPWGLTPVWGFGTVERSDIEGVAAGERFYGYFPMASHVAMQPTSVNAAGFLDGAPHRRALTPGYNHYARTSIDPVFATATEEAQMLLRPLFLTAFVIDDWLADNDHFGARRVILSSASSKTAAATAFLLAQREGLEIVGLTSATNASYVRSLGCYHSVLTYDRLADIRSDEPAAYVDMSANGKLRAALHRHFGDRLAVSCAVGATDWSRMEAGGDALPGPKPTRFFVPVQVGKRIAEWGAETWREHYFRQWLAFVRSSLAPNRAWLRIARGDGVDAVRQVWGDLVEGRVDPRDGHILSIRGDSSPARHTETKS